MYIKTKFSIGDTAYVFSRSNEHSRLEKEEFTVDAIIIEKDGIVYRCHRGISTCGCTFGCAIIEEKELHFEGEAHDWFSHQLDMDIEEAERELEYRKKRKEELLGIDYEKKIED